MPPTIIANYWCWQQLDRISIKPLSKQHLSEANNPYCVIFYLRTATNSLSASILYADETHIFNSSAYYMRTFSIVALFWIPTSEKSQTKTYKFLIIALKECNESVL